MSERTAVYRLFATDDTLLYVGVAGRFGRRWQQHAKVQPWWSYVDHQSVHWYPRREDALLVEKIAIRDERPVYNIAGSPWVGGVLDDGTGFYVTPKPPPEPRDSSREYQTRVFYERGLMDSDLSPLDRLVALVLASKADFRTCQIPERRMPSLSTLATDTGMSLSSVPRSLNRLERGGWVKRTPGRGRGNRTFYALSAPVKWPSQDADDLD